MSNNLTMKLSDIVESNGTAWDHMKAQLVTLLWKSIDVNLIPLFYVYENYFDILSHA